MTTIALVSCVKQKSPFACQAQDLYTSPLFHGMRRFAEQKADEWYILSAKYGLLLPLEKVGPYEMTLKTMKQKEREAWANKVWKKMVEYFPSGKNHTIIFLAGETYREHLEPWCKNKGYSIWIPMMGLKMGEQLKYLNKHTSPAIEGFGL